MGVHRSQRSVANIDIDCYGGGRGQSLLYLHGGFGLEGSKTFLDALSERFEVIAPVHPGFGASDWPERLRSVSDLAFFYLDLADQLELENALLVGSCFGGWLGAEVLIRSTRRFERAVLMAPLGAKFSDRATRDITDLHSLGEEEVHRCLYYQRAPEDYSNHSEEALSAIARNREAFTYFGWKPYMHDPSLTNWLHRIDIPTLLVWGEHDGFVNLRYAESYHRAISGSTLEVVPEAGHFPEIEQQSQVLEQITQFADAATRRES